MKVKNRIDNKYGILVLCYFMVCLFIGSITIFFHVSAFYVALTSVLLCLNVIFTYLIIARKYELGEKNLIIKVGPFKKVIKYKDIKKAFITKTHRLSFNTSEKCICIKTKDQEYYISPYKMDEVLLKLINHRGKNRWFLILLLGY